MKHLLFIVVALAVGLAACQQHQSLTDAITQADAVVCSQTDSALAILATVDTFGAPERLKAHYVLLFEKASDKAYRTNTADSAISAAVRYYEGRGDTLEAQALYYKGVVQFNKQDYGYSLISLTQAHEAADRAKDIFYKAMSSRTLSDVYNVLL